ncbi:MAG: helix-turn-helix domain-containing protein [Chitinophagaceae bacterium]
MTTDFNTLFQLAFDYIQFTNESIFLTGKAGTGKTTFLKQVLQHCAKQSSVIAPTGVAAINAGGTTIHSFFQLPFSPFIPSVIRSQFSLADVHNNAHNSVDKHHLLSRVKLNREKREVIRQIELLIIDEISMVRCDTLDAIDTVLRVIRNKPYEPFGGVQMLFIGDLHQLPPVIPQEEWHILQEFYDSPFFFSSKVIQQQSPVYIELEKIYRQTDHQFIDILNKVRNHQLDTVSLEILNEHFQSNFSPNQAEGFITLTTHNAKAQTLNQLGLEKIISPTEKFTATIEGDFSDKAFPAEEVLELKMGAQVMFIKNDKEKIRRYFNGKIGTITAFEEDGILVSCNDTNEPIKVLKEKWENIKYSFNATTQQVEETVIGSFTQYPLRLAWAITIHKSQGLTFQKAIIDAGAAFAAGQVYVALSRCTSLEGLVLKSTITSNSLFVDDRIISFSKTKSNQAALQNNLLLGKQLYQQKIISELFDFSKAIASLKDILALLELHHKSFSEDALVWFTDFYNQIADLQKVAEKFKAQIHQLTIQNESSILQERIVKATAYFLPPIQSFIQLLHECTITTDSRNFANELLAEIQLIYGELYSKNTLLQTCVYGFDMLVFQEKKMGLKVPAYQNSFYSGTSFRRIITKHPVLFQQLKQLRDSLCEELKLPIYLVASTKTLEELVDYLPQTLHDLENISGFGTSKIQQFGQQFLTVITSFCLENQLQTRIQEKESVKKSPSQKQKSNQQVSSTKENTYQTTLRLYKNGSSIETISAERNLAKSTIEGHLAVLVKEKEIDVFTLMSKEKVEAVISAIKKLATDKISLLLEELGNDYAYSELRYGIQYYHLLYPNTIEKGV